ncbi:hypothetical protein SmphiM6_117 [Sinorhizobium phage phiM6]|nr:hypothetical protein SmphiM6_117 [Sinorhizobium phage phiM6]
MSDNIVKFPKSIPPISKEERGPLFELEVSGITGNVSYDTVQVVVQALTLCGRSPSFNAEERAHIWCMVHALCHNREIMVKDESYVQGNGAS